MCSPAALPTALKIPVTWGQRGAAGRSSERHLKWNCECHVGCDQLRSKLQQRGCWDSRAVPLPRRHTAAMCCQLTASTRFAKTWLHVPSRHATETTTTLVLWHLQRTKILCAATPRFLRAQTLSASRVCQRMGVHALSTSDIFSGGCGAGVCFKIKWLRPLIKSRVPFPSCLSL